MKKLLTLVLSMLLGGEAFAISERTWNVTSRIGGASPGSIFTQAPDEPPPPDFDGTTGVLASNGANIDPSFFDPGEAPPNIQTAGVGTFGMSSGFLSAAAAHTAQSVAPDATIFDARASVSLRASESLIVEPTAALPTGTFVDVRLALALAYGADIAGAPTGFENGIVFVRPRASMTGGNQSISATQGDQYFELLPTTTTAGGIVLSGTDEILASVAVGTPFAFDIGLDVQSTGQVQTHGVGNLNNTTNVGIAQAAFQFGFEVLQPTATAGLTAPADSGPVVAFLSGGATPHAASVSLDAATALLPGNPLGVPAPAAWMLLGAPAALLAQRCRRC